jgi:4-oxalocrotonate tautomerase
MPLVQVTMWKGRNSEVKERLIQNLTSAVADTLEVPKEHVRIILYEVGREDWGVGGVPASKKEWGY